MFRLTSVVLVTSLALAIAAEEGSAPIGGHAQVLALNTTSVAAAAPALDDYTGLYETPDGATFVVARAGESLSIEMPETMALPIRAAAGASFVLDGSMQIAFETVGGQARLIVSRP